MLLSYSVIFFYFFYLMNGAINFYHKFQGMTIKIENVN